ncbi:sodium-dependent bicarbonate transport family permease [Shewanella donghaensis]|uniref:sodium-dependent bicarbonate transport family permease n=1 Tax=Shewanella donghaensis TaxID=238836 RepID=UPI0011840BE3|nr:sodium-dependent bicarbonate transport family permease [Shewanella donghaensis]
MQIDVSIAFFLMGVFAVLVRADIQFPRSLYQSLILFLMIAIGLKGGVALAEHASWALVVQSIYVILFGFALPLIAFPILYYIGALKRDDAASIAAHYGSVSVGTYAVAVAFLEAKGIHYEAYIPLFVVLLEMPAIVIGILLAKSGAAPRSKNKSKQQVSADRQTLLHEMFFNQGVVLMVGGLVIGYFAGEGIDKVAPLFFGLFNAVLALFLLEMGMVAASRLKDLKHMGSFMLAFGFAMPMVGGVLGSLLGVMMGLSVGGVTLVAVLGASASYIAVPAAMRIILPNANHSLSITASLGITFPFNVLVGIPVYLVVSQWLLSF